MLILIRHGQSEWNLQNRFTGWVDVPLTEKGIEEAKKAGQLLKSKGYEFDVAYSSYLQRAIKTCWIVLEELGQGWIPMNNSWRLNERHYGGLQGLNKTETAEKHGKEQVHIWRRSYDTLPPEAEGPFQDKQLADRRYKGVTVPKCEALKQTVERVLPYWEKEIAPELKAGKNVLIVAHGNSLRALVKHLANMSDKEIVSFEFKTGVPLLCELNQNLSMASMEFLQG